MHLAVLTARINVVVTLAAFGADVNAVDVVRGALWCVWLCLPGCVSEAAACAVWLCGCGFVCAIAEWSHAAALGCTRLCREEHWAGGRASKRQGSLCGWGDVRWVGWLSWSLRRAQPGSIHVCHALVKKLDELGAALDAFDNVCWVAQHELLRWGLTPWPLLAHRGGARLCTWLRDRPSLLLACIWHTAWPIVACGARL